MSVTFSSHSEARPRRERRVFGVRLRNAFALTVAIGAGLLMVSAVLALNSYHTFHAAGEQIAPGSGVSGAYTDTFAADDIYRVIKEGYVSGQARTMGDDPSAIPYAVTSTNVVNFTPYTMPAEGGFIYRIAIYITETGSTQLRVALYEDTEGLPHALMAQSQPLTVTDYLAQPGWLWFDVPPQQVPGGTRYWLAYQANNENAKLGMKFSLPIEGYRYRTWSWGPFPSAAGSTWGPISRRALYQVAYTVTQYTLDATYTVPATSGMDAYTLTFQGGTSGEPFTVVADGQTVGTISYSPASQSFFSDNMESGPGGWTANGFSRIVTDASHYSSPTRVWWTDDVPYGSMTYLTSAPITLPFSVRNPELRFWHRVVSEQDYDGGWVEYRAQNESGTWTEWSTLADSMFIQGGYNSTVSGTHPAWTGTVSDVVRIQVPVTATIRPSQWRWVFRCDPVGMQGPYQPDGWWIDDVRVLGTVSADTNLVLPLPVSLVNDGQVTVRFRDTLTNTYADLLGIDLIEVTGFLYNRPPTVTITTPNGGEHWSGTRTVEWRGADPNRDVITYNVYLSTNGGSTWTTSLYQVAYSETEVPATHTWNGLDTTAFGESANCLIRIEASDGAANASDRSDTPFTIENAHRIYLPLVLR